MGSSPDYQEGSRGGLPQMDLEQVVSLKLDSLSATTLEPGYVAFRERDCSFLWINR